MVSRGVCWIWLDPCARWKQLVQKFISSQNSNETIVLELSPNDLCSTDAQKVTGLFLDLCRRNNLLTNFQTSFLNTKDHLLALQLALAHASNQSGDIVTMSDVMFCHKQYIGQLIEEDVESSALSSHLVQIAISNYRSFLVQSNSVNEWQLVKLFTDFQKNPKHNSEEHDTSVLNSSNILCFGWPNNNTVQETMIRILLNDRTIIRIVLETPLNASISDWSEISSQVELKTSAVVIDDVIDNLISSADYSYCQPRVPVSQIYSEDVIGAFVRLLINSRDELALAKALTSPLVKMTHEGFTALKKQSSAKGMPMCQTAISYVTRLQLGGKGYAPPGDCPLKAHAKQLAEFVELLQKLQNFIEEEATPVSVTKKIINVLKMKLLKTEEIKILSLNNAIEKINFLVTESKQNDFTVDESMKHILNLKTLSTLKRLSDKLCCSYFYEANLKMLRTPGTNSQRTPLNVPSVLHFFRTPEIEDDDDDPLAKPLRQRTLLKDSAKKSSNKQKFAAGLPWGDNKASPKENLAKTPMLSPIIEMPSNSISVAAKLAEHDAEIVTPKRKKVVKPAANRKRNILTDLTNQDCSLKKGGKKLKTIKSKELGKGQQQLTAFFATNKK